MKPIELGRTSEACNPCPCPVVTKDTIPEKHYPTLYVDGGDELAKLPEAGQMTVTFDRESVTKTDRDGKKSVNVVLKIKSIDKVRAIAEAKEDTGKTLDKYAEEEVE